MAGSRYFEESRTTKGKCNGRQLGRSTVEDGGEHVTPADRCCPTELLRSRTKEFDSARQSWACIGSGLCGCSLRGFDWSSHALT
jgi:hypothetical protein